MRYLCLLILLMAWPVMGQMPASAGPSAYAPDRTLAQALSESGDNRSQLKQALKALPESQVPALEFLIRYMPKTDLTTLSSEFLVEDITLAYQARADHPWAKAVPNEIFYNDVVPYASLDVRRDRWRADFYQRFSTMVKDSKTLREAVLVINGSIRDEVKVDYSTKRKKADQSPYESMETGLASCTGLSVLLCDALRSVGIPARIAGIPMWTTKRGNHNWVEFYDPQSSSWHFTEYYLDSKGIDHGWLLADAARANPDSFYHAVYATSWKPTGKNFPMVWNMDSNSVPGVNVTRFYQELAKSQGISTDGQFELRIEFLDANGDRKPVEVALYQLDHLIGKGQTPSPRNDTNQFLSFKVDPKQNYQLRWTDTEGKPVSRAITPEKERSESNHRKVQLK